MTICGTKSDHQYSVLKKNNNIRNIGGPKVLELGSFGRCMLGLLNKCILKTTTSFSAVYVLWIYKRGDQPAQPTD